MKRLFYIVVLLFLIGTVYAQGPRYRFKSRRALQSLWRKEMMENPQNFNYSGKGRKLNERERLGEGKDDKAGKSRYGVVVADPFSNVKLGRIDKGYGDEEEDEEGGNGIFNGYSAITKKPGGKTDDGPHITPWIPGVPDNPYIGGSVGENGQPYVAPPKLPVGDGLPVLLILTATLIAIKKRLSSK